MNKEKIKQLCSSWFAAFKASALRSSFRLFVCTRWALLAILTGLIVGAYSTVFAAALREVTNLRIIHTWLLYFLPFGGLIIVFLYRMRGVKHDLGTSLVINAIQTENYVPLDMAFLIFASTILTHLFGGSVGREGAALQMGGSLGYAIGYLLRLNLRSKKVLVMCGMSAAFAAVFGTPMAAAIFSLEAISVGIMHYSALVPCFFSSLVASHFAANLGIAPESFTILSVPEISIGNSAMICLLAVFCGLLSIFFCKLLHQTHHLYQHFFKNQYLRVFAGGCLIIVLTLCVGNYDYNGAGINVIEKALEGEVVPWAFLLKMLFTALTLGAGFKGGEIVPTFCVGAAFGCLFGQIIGLSPSLCAAVAMSATFCGVTNCPISTLLISFELFGFEAIPYFMLAISISYLISGYQGLYGNQRIIYSKYRLKYINRPVMSKDQDDVFDKE